MIGQQAALLGLRDNSSALVDQQPNYSGDQGGIARPGRRTLLRSDDHDQGLVLANANIAQSANLPKGMFDTFVNTCQRWGLDEGARLKLLGFSENDFLGSQLLAGYVSARTQDVKDRVGYILAISLGLGTIFNEAVKPELDWLSKVHPKLGESPLKHILRGRMVHLISVAALVAAERNL